MKALSIFVMGAVFLLLVSGFAASKGQSCRVIPVRDTQLRAIFASADAQRPKELSELCRWSGANGRFALL